MPGILRLSGIEIGSSAVIALVNVTGKIKASRLPDTPNDVQFALADGRTAYFPLFVADCIRLAGVQPRIPFELMRPNAHEVRVKTIDASDYTSELGGNGHNGQNGHNPTGGAEASEPPVSVRGNNVNSQEKEVNLPARSIEIQQPNGPTDPACTKFMGAYKAAIDVLIEAQVYAKRQGLLMEVHCEDVRCLAATMMIQAGGR